MIILGASYGGPELENCKFENMWQTISRQLDRTRGPWTARDKEFSVGPFDEDPLPAVNVVFYIPGSLLSYGNLKSYVDVGRFSQAKKLVLVRVPVPREMANSTECQKFILNAIRRGNELAAEVFKKKGIAGFDRSAADDLVDRVEAALNASPSH